MTRQEKYQEQKATCLKRFRGNNKPGKTLVLFLHHGEFCELLTEPIENRIDFIIANKAEGEIETRLKWMQPVIPNTLSSKCRKVWDQYDKEQAKCAKGWAELVKAWAEYNKARAEYDKISTKYYKTQAKCKKAWAECDKVRAEFDKAWAKRYGALAEFDKVLAEFTKLYEPIFMKQNPGCPWNGRTLFS